MDARGKYEILLKKYLWSSFFTDRYENSAASRAFSDFISMKNIIEGTKKEDGTLWKEEDVPVLDRSKFPICTYDELLRVGWPKGENIRARGIMSIFSKLGALDFADGKPLSREQLINGRRHYHHIFPDALLREAGIGSYLALNCALITDKTNLNISDKAPFDYVMERCDWVNEADVNKRLKSHLIPINELKSADYKGLAGNDKKEKIKEDFNNFIQKRASYVIDAINILVYGGDIDAFKS